jgi:hypothetical protein
VPLPRTCVLGQSVLLPEPCLSRTIIFMTVLKGVTEDLAKIAKHAKNTKKKIET